VRDRPTERERDRTIFFPLCPRGREVVERQTETDRQRGEIRERDRQIERETWSAFYRVLQE